MTTIISGADLCCDEILGDANNLALCTVGDSSCCLEFVTSKNMKILSIKIESDTQSPHLNPHLHSESHLALQPTPQKIPNSDY